MSSSFSSVQIWNICHNLMKSRVIDFYFPYVAFSNPLSYPQNIAML